jgi:hypothetical protein
VWVQIIAKPTDTTPIVTVQEALTEFREQDPSAEPDAWTRRIAAAELAFESETGLKLRRQTARIEGRSIGRRVIWLPIGPLVTLNRLTVEGTDQDLSRFRLIGSNAIECLADPYYCSCDLIGWIDLEAIVGYDPATGVHAEIKQALLQLIGHWSAHREAALSQTSILGGSVLEVPWSWKVSLDRYRLMVAA